MPADPSPSNPPRPVPPTPRGEGGQGDGRQDGDSRAELWNTCLDAERETLAPDQAAAWRRRLATEPEAAAVAAEALRFEETVRAALSESVPEGLALRLALRVRDQVQREEQTARRREPEVVGTLVGMRRRLRFLLVALSVHVAVLGWVVLRRAPPPQAPQSPRLARWIPPEQGRLPGIHEEPGMPEWLPLVASEGLSDDLLARHGLPELEGEPALPWVPEVRVAEHPAPVGLPMLGRLRGSVKSSRLARAGLNANGTLRAVEQSLRALAALQRPDGSFPSGSPGASSTLGELGRTALALLPFLAEGRCSAALPGLTTDPVVSRGLGWVRAQAALPGASGGAGVSWPAEDLALGLLALSEDFMLAYGRLTPAEAQERARELGRWSERLVALQTAEGSFAPEGTSHGAVLWPLLALDAARLAGVSAASEASMDAVVARVERWFERLPRSSAGVPADARGHSDVLLTAGEMLLARRSSGALPGGTEVPGAAVLLAQGAEVAEQPLTGMAVSVALYRRAPSSFRALNRARGDSVLERLAPTGLVRAGDAVIDTALVLLTLQAAYRVY